MHFYYLIRTLGCCAEAQCFGVTWWLVCILTNWFGCLHSLKTGRSFEFLKCEVIWCVTTIKSFLWKLLRKTKCHCMSVIETVIIPKTYMYHKFILLLHKFRLFTLFALFLNFQLLPVSCLQYHMLMLCVKTIISIFTYDPI